MKAATLMALVLPLMLSAAVARADGEDNVTRARARFASGAQAYREARYREAIDLFLQANELDPHPELIFNVGQAYEKLGDVPNALRSYRDYLRKAPGASDRATVEASIKNLETRLRDKGVQQVSVFSTPAGAQVRVDQKDMCKTPCTFEIAPGRHVLVLRATGYPETAKEFVLAGDRAMDIDVSLAQASPAAAPIAPTATTTPAPAPPPAAPDAPASSGPRIKPWTWATLGVGVAGLGAALGLELARQGAESDARADPTQVGFKDKYDTMTSYQTAARVLVGVGAAATVAGGVLLFIDLRSGRDEAPPRNAAFGCFGTTCGAFAFGSF